MPETAEVLLWCAALATWLMMFLAIVVEGLKKIANRFRRSAGTKRKVID
ncbi:hypothetical protein SAMN05216338_104760 [Bradyrhizobium sp. Rc2d]|nr:hypothetical protein SAMN05216338_104760 [Bradyrhizobium sp. Rc2d]